MSAWPCPKCQGPCRVLNVRRQRARVYRRHICERCGHRFNTYESTEPAITMVAACG